MFADGYWIADVVQGVLRQKKNPENWKTTSIGLVSSRENIAAFDDLIESAEFTCPGLSII